MRPPWHVEPACYFGRGSAAVESAGLERSRLPPFARSSERQPKICCFWPDRIFFCKLPCKPSIASAGANMRGGQPLLSCRGLLCWRRQFFRHGSVRAGGYQQGFAGLCISGSRSTSPQVARRIPLIISAFPQRACFGGSRRGFQRGRVEWTRQLSLAFLGRAGLFTTACTQVQTGR